MANGVITKARSLGFLIREHGLEAIYFCAIVAVGMAITIDASVLAQDPFASITTRAESARDQIVVIGQAASGLVAAVLLVLAMFKVVNWGWVAFAVFATAGLSAIGPIQDWLNS